jgi:hypothetical protein
MPGKSDFVEGDRLWYAYCVTNTTTNLWECQHATGNV